MYKILTIRGREIGTSLLTAILLGGAGWAQAQDVAPDDVLGGWLGREFTVDSSTINDRMPVGGKLTFIFDAQDNVVRVCTRTVGAQRGAWRMDFAVPCNVTLTFTRGTRFCTVEDVKAGNAEVLSACHRLRSRDVAMLPADAKGAVELNDMIGFLILEPTGKHTVAILVDSPSRVTGTGVVIVKQ
jgi:hypothetical protein